MHFELCIHHMVRQADGCEYWHLICCKMNEAPLHSHVEVCTVSWLRAASIAGR